MLIKKLPFIIVSSVIFIFDIVIAFILNEYSIKLDGDSVVLYIIAKAITALLFMIIVIAGLAKKDIASYVIIYAATIILQLLPLAIRYLSLSKGGFVISIILFFIVMILYLALIGGLIILSKKNLTAAKKLEGTRIPIEGENDDDDEKNHKIQ